MNTRNISSGANDLLSHAKERGGIGKGGNFVWVFPEASGGDDSSSQVSCSQPCNTAYRTMSMRLCIPILFIAFALCVSTVFMLI